MALPQPYTETSWDYEADVIVVGAGAAGLAACIEARAHQLSAIAIESQSSYGGNSIISSGGISIPCSPLQKQQGIEDSAELMFEDTVSMTQEVNNPEILKILCDQASQLWDWLTERGIFPLNNIIVASTGQSVPRQHHFDATLLCNSLYQDALTQGAQFHFNTRGVELIQDPFSKRVIGILAEKNGKTVSYKAKKGLVMSTGGFTRNTKLLNQFIFGSGAENIACNSAPGDDGSGIIMCLALGADTRHMGYCVLYTVHNPDGDSSTGSMMYHMGAILVNKEGKRFVNEEYGFDSIWEYVNKQPDQVCFSVWDEDIATKQRSNESFYYSQKKLEESGLLLKADTLPELAELMSIPTFSFIANVAKYNEDIQEYGFDTLFERKHLVAKIGKPTPLRKPPYYAWKTTNALLVTHGGIKKDVNCQAIDVMGNAIPGLFLAGNISGFCEMGIVPGTRRGVSISGCDLGGAIIFGRRAVQKIDKLMGALPS